MSEQREKLLCELVKEAKTPGETIRILLNKGVVSTTAMRDLEVYYTFRQRLACSRRTMHAVYDTEISTGYGKTTIYKARKRFED
jgi:hypothetical protein